MSKSTISDLMIACMDHGIDSERGSEAIVTIINANGWHSRHVSKAVEVALVNLEAHGYPEPYEPPPPELCINCRTPKYPCACGCFPIKPSIPPDVPGWMGASKGPSTEGDPIGKSTLDWLAANLPGAPKAVDDSGPTKPVNCHCGGTDIRVLFDADSGNRWGVKCWSCRMGVTGTIDGTRGRALELWAEQQQLTPSWDNPGPCVCGGTVLDKWDGSDGGGAYIRCSYHEGGCGRHREKPTMALALAAWVNREADKGES